MENTRELPTDLSMLTDEKLRGNSQMINGKLVGANSAAQSAAKSSAMKSDLDSRIKQMQFPHQVMQQ